MTTLEFDFNSLAEAQAFVDGVEYVNDSAITVLGIDTLVDRTFRVTIEDADTNVEEDEDN